MSGPGRLKLLYHLAISNTLYILLASATAALALRLSRLTPSDVTALHSTLLANLSLAVALLGLLAALATAYLMQRPRGVYLLDFACYKPGPEHTVTREKFMR